MKKLFVTLPWLLLLFPLLITTEVAAFGIKTETVSGKTVRYVYYHPSEHVELKPVLAQGKVGRTEALHSMANRTGAIAAINGTFFNAYDSNDLQPMGSVMIDRNIVHHGGGPTAVGMTTANTLQFFPTSSIAIRGGINGSREWPNNWSAWSVNHKPTSNAHIVLFTPHYKTNPLKYSNFTFVVVSNGSVKAITRNEAVIPGDGFVIAFGPDSRDQAGKFKVGDRVDYSTEVNQAALNHLLSAGPKLVTAGRVSLNFASEGISDPKLTSQSAQRSFIGSKQDGTVVMGTVNGVTMSQLANIAVQLGLVEAMNLDGGASSGLFYNGNYVTTPGRALSNALVLVKKEKTPRIEINGREIVLTDANAYIDQGTTMVPVRGVFEALGADISWDGVNRIVTATRGDVAIQLPIGKLEATVNGTPQQLQKPSTIRRDRTYIPLRFVSEALGASVQWDAQQYKVTIMD